MKRVLVLLIILALLVGMVGCPAGPEPTPPVEGSLTVSSTAGGVVTAPGEGGFTYEEGTVVNLVAEAEAGYRFVDWTGDVDTIADVEAASTTITMNGDYEITASFEETHDLTVSSTEGGSVTTPGEGVFTYEAGAVVSLVASPASGHRFVSWTGDVDTIADVTAASTTITMNDDYSIIAKFVAQYVLTIGSTEGGEVTAPGQGTFTYDAGTVVELEAEANEGYTFMEWTGDVDSVTDVTAASTTVTMNSVYTITASFAKGVWDWYDLDAIRDDLSGYYVLMNDLDSTTAGYAELAGPTANDGRGWQPIGSLFADPDYTDVVDMIEPFSGSFDGRGYEITDLFIDRPGEGGVGLFGYVADRGVVQNVGMVNVEVSGHVYVGAIAGFIFHDGAVNNSYGKGSVTATAWDSHAGGLVGELWGGVVSNSYFSGSVTGRSRVGGLVGGNLGTLSDSYFSGAVTGVRWVGGLVGLNDGSVANSHYNYDEVLINGENVISIGALFADDFYQWLANDEFLDVDERLSQEDGYYVINDVHDFKQLLAFGQDPWLKFRLENDLDLANQPNFFIPYLAGEFAGNDHKISNLNFNFDFGSHVGVFGYLARGGKVTKLGAEEVNIIGTDFLGGLVGINFGRVSDSYASGNVASWFSGGGLVGVNHGTVSNSYFRSGSVTGNGVVAGLVGCHREGAVINSFYDYDEVLINGQNVITIGALFGEDFEQWLASDKFLDVNERLSQEDGYYLIKNASDFRQLLAFGQDGTLKFRLKDDLDLRTEPNFYIPYLAGEFRGDGHQISNLSFNFRSVSQVGLFGTVTPGGKVSGVVVENVNVTGWEDVGGLVGRNHGTVTNSSSSGSIAGDLEIGGLVGGNSGNVHASYSTSSVRGYLRVGGLVGGNSWRGVLRNSYSTGSLRANGLAGGLVGWNEGTVINSYSTGSVNGEEYLGGLAGHNPGTVLNSFWDVETSGMGESDGGAGKTTAKMHSIATFLDVRWDVAAVDDPDDRDPAYTWNIVDGQTYPFLSWQRVS